MKFAISFLITVTLALSSIAASAQSGKVIVQTQEKKAYVCGDITNQTRVILEKNGNTIVIAKKNSILVAQTSHKVCHAQLGWLSPAAYEQSFLAAGN